MKEFLQNGNLREPFPDFQDSRRQLNHQYWHEELFRKRCAQAKDTSATSPLNSSFLYPASLDPLEKIGILKRMSVFKVNWRFN